jgi:hypothetical protein
MALITSIRGGVAALKRTRTITVAVELYEKG